MVPVTQFAAAQPHGGVFVYLSIQLLPKLAMYDVAVVKKFRDFVIRKVGGER